MKYSWILIVLFFLVSSSLTYADTVIEGNVESHTSVTTNIQGSGSVSTHIESSVNGNTKTLDSNKSGTYTLDNSSSETTTTPSLEPTSTPIATPSVAILPKDANLKTAHTSFLSFIVSLKTAFHSAIQRLLEALHL